MSEFEQDWMMRQIKNISGTVARILFHKESPGYSVTDERHLSEGDRLHLELAGLVDAGELNRAENRLFEALEPDKPELLEVALDFYARLDELDERSLEESSFSREEITQGLLAVMKFYKVPMEQIVAYFQD